MSKSTQAPIWIEHFNVIEGVLFALHLLGEMRLALGQHFVLKTKKAQSHGQIKALGCNLPKNTQLPIWIQHFNVIEGVLFD